MLLSDLLETKYLPRRIGIAGGAYNLRHAVELYSHWLGKPASVDHLDDDLLCSFLAARAKHNSAATVNGERSKLLAIWRFAAERGLKPASPRFSAVRADSPVN